MAAEALTIFGGEPRSYKTFTAMNVLSAVAGNGEVMGLSVMHHGPVLHVGEEGQAKAVADRLARLTRHYIPTYPFRVAYRNGLKLADPPSFERLRPEVEAAKPVQAVIDTFARVFVGNENDANDISRHLDPLEALIRDFGCAVILIHHTNKSGTGTAGYQLHIAGGTGRTGRTGGTGRARLYRTTTTITRVAGSGRGRPMRWGDGMPPTASNGV